MTWTDDYHFMMLRVLTSLKCHPVAEWMGLAYICFAEDMDAYDPEKGTSPVSYYGFRLRERVQRERLYGSLVHTPLTKQRVGEESTILGLETPLGASQAGNSAMTLLDVLETPQEAENAEEKLQDKMLALLDGLDVTAGEKQCVPYLRRAILGEDDAVAPRALRAHNWTLRKKLRNAWENCKK